MLAVLLPAYGSRAAVTEKDVQVIGRVLNLLEGRQPGPVEIAVISNDVSSDVSDFLELTRGGKRIGGLTLHATAVTSGALPSSTASVVFIPAALPPAYFNRIFAVAQEKKLVTISNSDVCLMQRKCAIMIISDPAVDIKISQSAAAATNVTFSSNLRMLVKETP